MNIQSKIAAEQQARPLIIRRADAIAQLGQAVAAFAVEVRMEGMSRSVAETLARLLRVGRYLEEAATLLSRTHALSIDSHRIADDATQASVLTLLATAQSCLTVCAETGYADDWRGRLDTDELDFESHYQEAKATVLRAAATHRLTIAHADQLLDSMSRTRRMVEQVIKASLMLLEETATQQRETGGAAERPEKNAGESDAKSV